MKETSRRDFIKVSSMAAAAMAGGCATAPAMRKAAWKPDEKAFIKAALIHLGSNMWTDVRTPQKNDKPNPEDSWDFKDRVDYLRAKDEVWRDCIDAMKRNGFNMVVIDLGEALEYDGEFMNGQLRFLDAPADSESVMLTVRLHEDGMLSLSIPFRDEEGIISYFVRWTDDETE